MPCNDLFPRYSRTMKTEKKISRDRLAELNALLSQLSPKEIATVEAMISSRSKKAEDPVLAEPIEAVLGTEQGKDLLSLLKQLKETEIAFQLSQIQSLNMLVNVSWEVADVEYYPYINFEDKTRSVLAGSITEMLHDEFLEDDVPCLPVNVRQELNKERKKVEATLAALSKKKHSFSLKDSPQLQVDVVLTFSDLSLDTGYLDFLPNLDIKPKYKAQITENWRLSLEETLSEAYHEGTLENDLPVNISAQIKATDALREKITKLVSTLAKKHRWNDPSALLGECCCFVK